MKFIPLRDIRNHPQAVLSKLKKEKEIILTSHGKPVAMMSDLNEETFERDISRHRRKNSAIPQAAESTVAYTTEDPEILKAWIDECERRYQNFLDGKTKGIPAFKALAQIRRRLAQK